MIVDGLRRLRQTVAPRLKDAAAAGAYHSGVYRLVGSRYAGMGVILMLHRVCPDDRPIIYPGFMVPTSAVDELLSTIRASKWDIVSLDDVQRRLEQGAGGRRFVCFTFDDGYADNLTLALPVFRKHGAPFAVYITTGFLDRSIPGWWGALEDLILTRDVLDFPAVGDGGPTRFKTATLNEKRAAYNTLDDLGHRHGAAFFAVLKQVLDKAGIDPQARLDRDALSVEQARALAADSLVTIGAHTVSHARLSTLGPAEAWREISQSRATLQSALGVEVNHFAYPFGGSNSCGQREVDLAMRAGFRTAVTTRRGNIFPAHKSHLACLPRRVVPTTRRDAWNALFGLESLHRREPRFMTI